MPRALLLFLLCLALLIGSSWEDSPSFDEPEHITAGYLWVTRGEGFMNPMHPPLIKDLAGLCLRGLMAPPPPAYSYTMKSQSISRGFFDGHVDVQRMTRVARIPNLLIAAGFVALYYLALARSQGPAAASWAAGLLVLTPLSLAHGSRVHNDVPAAAATFAVLWLLARYLENPRPKPLAWLALATGLAQLVKHSMLLLYAFHLLVILLRPQRRQLLKQAVWFWLAGLVIVWLAYLAHPVPSEYQEPYQTFILTKPRGPVMGAVQSVLLECGRLPGLRALTWYAVGAIRQRDHLRLGHRLPSYLDGKLYQGRNWLFFPRLALTKQPLALWFLILLSLPGLRRLSWNLEMRLLAGFAAAYLAVALSGRLNLGLRHLLPVFPCLYALAGLGLAQAAPRLRWLSVSALVAAGLTLAAAFPHYLAYYNLLAQGQPTALGSDYDWGTDLLRLQRAARAKEPLYVHYYGGLPAQAYLPQAKDLQFEEGGSLPDSGWVAMSMNYYLPVQHWLRQPLPPGADAQQQRLWRWLGRLEEDSRPGPSLILLRIR